LWIAGHADAAALEGAHGGLHAGGREHEVAGRDGPLGRNALEVDRCVDAQRRGQRVTVERDGAARGRHADLHDVADAGVTATSPTRTCRSERGNVAR